jgi:hypothetical protein
MEWGIFIFLEKWWNEIEITLFLVPMDGPSEFYFLGERILQKYLLLLVVLAYFTHYFMGLSLSPWLKKCNIFYNTLFVIKFNPMTSLL